jgi:PAS domain S-box-containing protein
MPTRTETQRGLDAMQVGPVDGSRFFDAVMDISGDCIKILDLDGRLQFMSSGGQRVMEVDDFARLRDAEWPTFFPETERAAVVAAIATARAGDIARFQSTANTAKGNRRWWDIVVSPIRDTTGAVTHLVSLSRDISAMKQAADDRDFLFREMQHRMKNALAVVQSVVNQTLRHSDDIAAAREEVTGRLAAIAAAHDLLVKDDWNATPLRALVNGAAGILARVEGRLDIQGPDLNVGPRTAQGLSLAFHELMTNAAKYGSLSVPDGRLAIRWSTEGNALAIDWEEAGGPPVAEPRNLGFGALLVTRALAAPQRTIEVVYAPEGLRWRFRAPLCDLD